MVTIGIGIALGFFSEGAGIEHSHEATFRPGSNWPCSPNRFPEMNSQPSPKQRVARIQLVRLSSVGSASAVWLATDATLV